ncbi:MAG TPA: polysaccharide deacetylase family protein [Candidatus Sulfotelmatobacter sp.]|nr:polysaccharide deacetylase family protein [Candidatus Sulfotelmatobacter sp.]
MTREDVTATPGMVLAYHEVLPESNYAYCVTRDNFAVQLNMLNVLAQEAGQRFQARITFDDGEQSQSVHALPLLKECGISATYFVNPGLVGTEPKFLNWNQLREVQGAGHSMQSHGWSHKFLTFCDDQELALELAASRKTLEDKLGAGVEEISVPGGRWDRRVIEACARAGYKRIYVSEPWIATEMSGVKVLGRFMVRRTTTLAELKKIVQRDGRALWAMKIRSQLRHGVVRLVGDGLYHRLWCRLTGYNEFEAARRQDHYS